MAMIGGRPRPTFTHRGSRRHVTNRSTVKVCAVQSVSVEEGKKLLDRSGYKFVDLRPAHEYDQEHLTKPPRSSINLPFSSEAEVVSQLQGQFPNRSVGLLVACADGGEISRRAVEALASAGYTSALQVEGGFTGWTQVFSTSGRRKPPPGRWVSTGKEALKSGLNIPGVAESYDEGGNLISARYAEGLKDGQSL